MSLNEQEIFNHEVWRVFECLREFKKAHQRNFFSLSNEAFIQKYNAIQESESNQIIELFEAAAEAKAKNLDIPKELSYLMIEYFTRQFSKSQEPDYIDRALKHDQSSDRVRTIERYLRIIDEIIEGFDNSKENPTTRTNLNLTEILEGRVIYKLSAYEFGYLLAKEKEKLYDSDVQRYFVFYLSSSLSKVKKIYSDYRLSGYVKEIRAEQNGTLC